MTIHDFRNLEPDATLDADVCIVGSGPAGWTLAQELRGQGLRILVLESGGVLESGVMDREIETESLNETEDVGVPLFNGRRRTLGGTPESIPWGNRCIAFEPIDYRQRSWVPHSGWPFDEREIAPYLDRASRHMGAGPYLPGGPASCPLDRPAVDPDKLANVCWYFGRGPQMHTTIRYGQLFRQRRHPDVRVLVHATVMHLNTNPEGSRITAVEIGHPEGHRATVTARTVVLCAGGVENPRILLYSNRVVPAGLGNGHDLVGRYLMDHPRDLGMAVSFDARHTRALRRMFGSYMADTGEGRYEVVGGLALSEALQEREGLLNCAAWPNEEVDEDDPFNAGQRMFRARAIDRTDLRRVAASPVTFGKAMRTWLYRDQPFRHKLSRIGFYIGSEQRPDPDSRVTLTGRLDRLGLPIARTDWRISTQDRDSQAVLARLIAAEFKRLGLPEPRLADWITSGRHQDAVLSDGCHPTATTRMSTDPRAGVVDPDCRVHGVDGLYVAGSSVFPTAGHANPTLMIVAMAVRLAEHLKIRLRQPAAAPLAAVR